MKIIGGVAVLAVLAVSSACGGATTAADPPKRSVVTRSVTARPSPTPDAVPSDTPTPTPTPVPAAPPAPFPHGYPKVVPVRTLPMQVRSWYAQDYKRAVAIAPGVWIPLASGATVSDAVDGAVLDGFCGSIKAYERKYLDGADQAGTCW